MKRQHNFNLSAIVLVLGLSVFCNFILVEQGVSKPIPDNAFIGNWACKLPGGHAAWLSFSITTGTLTGEIWTVGAPNKLTELRLDNDTLHFKRKCAVGIPDYPGGAPTGRKVFVRNHAKVDGDIINLVMERPLEDGTIEKLPFNGKRMPPLPH